MHENSNALAMNLNPSLIAMALLSLVSVYLIINLWVTRPNDSIVKKTIWSAVILFPVFGWILYGGMYNYPSVKPRGEQCSGGLSGRSYIHHPKRRGRL
jgi:hypothetical protein